jgi:hypothetical protein
MPKTLDVTDSTSNHQPHGERRHENDDLPRTGQRLRSQAIRGNLGRNGQDDDQTRHRESSGHREGHGKEAQRRPEKWGREMKPKWDSKAED